jgi:type II secretory pathway pseudopilin PulG
MGYRQTNSLCMQKHAFKVVLPINIDDISNVYPPERKLMLRLRSVMQSSRAAIDLASIMVGVIIIGLIGGVIAATVFAVIPWSQDKAAKQQLDSVHTAQNAFFGLSSDPSTDLTNGKKNSFANSAELNNASLLTSNVTYCTVPTVDGKDYHAYAKSGSGKWFYALNSDKAAKVLTEGLVPCITADIGGKPVTIVDPAVDNGTTPVGTAPGAGTTPGAGTGTDPGTTTPAPTDTAPVFSSTTNLPDGQAGRAYSYSFTATSKTAVTYTGTNIPAGLTLNADTGVMSGTPTTPGYFRGEITATNAAGSSKASFNLSINAYQNSTIIWDNMGAGGIFGGTRTGQTSGSEQNYIYPGATFSSPSEAPGFPYPGAGSNVGNQVAANFYNNPNFDITLPNLEPGTYRVTMWIKSDGGGLMRVRIPGLGNYTDTNAAGRTATTTVPLEFTITEKKTVVINNAFYKNANGPSVNATNFDDYRVTKIAG